MYLSATMSLQGASRAAGLKLKPRLQANIAAEVMSAFINWSRGRAMALALQHAEVNSAPAKEDFGMGEGKQQ
jgi:hypothetical protein